MSNIKVKKLSQWKTHKECLETIYLGMINHFSNAFPCSTYMVSVIHIFVFLYYLGKIYFHLIKRYESKMIFFMQLKHEKLHQLIALYMAEIEGYLK